MTNPEGAAQAQDATVTRPATPSALCDEPGASRRLLSVCALLTGLWLLVTPWLYGRVQQMEVPHLRLEQSYEQWAEAMKGSDMEVYIRAGLGFAHGHGIASWKVVHGVPFAIPWGFQGAGAPFLIGVVARVFGDQQVFPYFVVVCMMHLLTSFCVVLLASAYLRSLAALLAVGLLSLLCVPVFNIEFGWGLTGSEAPSELLFALSLLPLQRYWLAAGEDLKRTPLQAAGFGLFIALASYVRPTYQAFAMFTLACVALFTTRRRGWRNALLFMLVAFAMMRSIQHPWEARNQRLFGQYSLAWSQYHGRALWVSLWTDWRLQAKWNPYGCMGWGDYLRPDLSKGIVDGIDANPREGSAVASRALVRAVMAEPVKAFAFKLSGYDILWLGDTQYYPDIGKFCLFSLVSLGLAVCLRWRTLSPEVWLYPLFLVALSVIIHYESRYAFPVYLVSTPIAVGMLMEMAWARFRRYVGKGNGPAL